jgi:hypothetical protein
MRRTYISVRRGRTTATKHLGGSIESESTFVLIECIASDGKYADMLASGTAAVTEMVKIRKRFIRTADVFSTRPK